MSSHSIPIPGAIRLPREAGSTWLETLHEWVTTVDHKKLGLMYIGYALLFLVIGGIEATIMRIQLAVPHAKFVSPQVFNRMFTMHGTTMIFFVAMPILFGFGNYLRGARHGLSPLECVELLDDRVRRPPALLQPLGGRWTVWGRQRAGRRLVGLCAADCPGLLQGA